MEVGKVVKTNVKKRWTVNGSIATEARDSYYCIDTTETNAPLFEQLQEPHAYLLMHGPRGSGKTTRTFQLAEQLAAVNFQCILVSLQEGIPLESPSEFWEAIGSRIHRDLGDTVHVIRSAASFVQFFDVVPQDGEQQQKFVLIVDEFDSLWRASAEVKNELLDTLRGIRQAAQHSTKTTRLHSFLGVGPFSILGLTGESSSPFNVVDAYCVPRFEQRHFRQLFSDYSQHSGVGLDGAIADDIYELTAGHAGLVSFCGKQLSSHLAQGRKHVKHADWVRYADQDLIPDLASDWATMRGLVREILRDDPDVKCARDFLLREFLYRNHYEERQGQGAGGDESDSEDEDEDKAKEANNDDDDDDDEAAPGKQLAVYVPAAHSDQEKYCHFLAREGILHALEGPGKRFILSSLLVRNMVASAIRSKMSRPSYPFGDPPRPDAMPAALDVPSLIIGCLPAMERGTLRDAPSTSFKVARSRGCPVQTVPSEAVYQDQLYFTLRSWLSEKWSYTIITQVNPALPVPRLHKRERCDVIISNSVWKCTIELSASPKPGELAEHITRSPRYKQTLGANEGWALNFDIDRGSDEDNRKLLAWQEAPANGEGVMHVFHDLQWTKARVYWRVTENGALSPIQHAEVDLTRRLL